MIRAGGAEWLWLVDPSVEPAADALDRLVEVADDPAPLPAPVLLASKVVTLGGEPDPGSLPVPETLDPDLDANACARGLLAVRVMRPGAVLVRRDAAGSPQTGRGAFLAWSARVLRHGPGLLVPSSIAVRAEPAPDDLLALARLVAGDGLAPSEKPWFAFHLAERALAATRAGPRSNRTSLPKNSSGS